MKQFCIITIFALLFALVFISISFYFTQVKHERYLIGLENDLRILGKKFKEYISQNNGSFPSSEEDLINKGFLAKKNLKESRITRYYIPDPVYGVGATANYFHEWKIEYGVKLEDLKVEEGKLYDINTNMQMVLIRGPFIRRDRFLNKVYEEVSLDLYNEMLHFQQDKAAETINDEKKINQ